MTWQVYIWRLDRDRDRIERDFWGSWEGPTPDLGSTIVLRWLPDDHQKIGDYFGRERVVRVKPRAGQIHTMAAGTSRASTMWIRIRRASAKHCEGST